MFWLAYAATCALLHHVLWHHYQDACRPVWWTFGLGDATVYCGVLHRALQLVGTSPLLAAVPGLRFSRPQQPPPRLAHLQEA